MPPMFYSGSLQEGISTAVGQQKLVLCFVTDDGEESKKWETEYLTDQSLSELIQNHAVALRLKAGSEEAGYLAQIFPLPRTPTIVIIKNGDLKEYITPEMPKADFLRRIQGAFSSPSHLPPALSPPSSANTPQSSSAAGSTHGSPTNSTNVQPERSENVRRILEERAARLKAEKEEAERKAKEERAKAKKKARAEAEAGVETEAALKHQQQQAYLRKRQQREEERRRILRRIEDDKAERKLRAAERERQRAGSENPSLGDVAAALVNAPETKIPALGRTGDVTAIQVRLFDGSTIRSRFETTATVSVVRQWVDEARGDDDNVPFTFKQVLSPMPNRNIDATEENKSLGELGLTPSSTLVLIPVQNYVTASQGVGNNVVAFIMRLIKVAIWQFFDVLFWLFGMENSRTPAERVQARREAERRERQPEMQFYNGNTTNTEPRPEETEGDE